MKGDYKGLTRFLEELPVSTWGSCKRAWSVTLHSTASRIGIRVTMRTRGEPAGTMRVMRLS